MKKVKTEITPLPCGVVSVNKKPLGRVLVGIVDGNRMPAFGFDVKDFIPNHFRMVPFGSFGIFAASRQPIEVRVILDGEVVRETRLFPKDPPAGMMLDPMMMKLMSETPTPHYLSGTEEGLPFLHNSYGEKSLEDVIADQLQPGRLDPPPTMDLIDKGHLELEELREDVDPDEYFSNLQLQKLQEQALPVEESPLDNVDEVESILVGLPGADEQLNEEDHDNTDESLPEVLDEFAVTDDLELDNRDHADWSEGDDINDDPEAYRQLAQLAAVAKFEAMTTAEPEIVDVEPEAQVLDREEYSLSFDPRKRVSSWAPSQGLLAIGVRFIQVPRDNEPLAVPDGFTYVMFQLNPWQLHLMARARLMGRLVIPSREQMSRVMEAEGFGGEVIQLPNISCGHEDPRR